MAQDFRLALHTWTIDSTPLEAALEAVAAAGFDGIELRRLDFVRCFERGLSRAQVVGLIRRSGVTVATLGTEYGWFFAEGAELARLLDVLRESCEIAAELGCSMLMSAPGQPTGTLAQAIAATRQAERIVAAAGLRLALEFNSQHPLVNRTAVLRQIVAGAEARHCGLLLDAYHLHRSQGIAAGLEGVTREELFAVQYSDAPARSAPARRPVDRLAPGAGVIDWGGFFGRLRQIGYAGWLSYEAPNPDLWARPALEVCRDGRARTRQLLAAARA